MCLLGALLGGLLWGGLLLGGGLGLLGGSLLGGLLGDLLGSSFLWCGGGFLCYTQSRKNVSEMSLQS